MEALSMSSATVPIYSYRRPRKESSAAQSKRNIFFRPSFRRKRDKQDDGNRSSTSSSNHTSTSLSSRLSTSTYSDKSLVHPQSICPSSPSVRSLSKADEQYSVHQVHELPAEPVHTPRAALRPSSFIRRRTVEIRPQSQQTLVELPASPAKTKFSQFLPELPPSPEERPAPIAKSEEQPPVEMAATVSDSSRVTGHTRGQDGSETSSTVNFAGINFGTQNQGQYNPIATYQHIQDMAAKRVSTLDYLRKTHEGRVYWFNTFLYSRADISKLPSFDPKKLARRATNFLLLGISLPTILDLNATSPMDYLRALNALLVEFETYQHIHPADGSNSSSLSRARIPHMFKRSTTSKGRRTSSAADIGLPMSSNDSSDTLFKVNSSSAASVNSASFPSSEQELLPGEEYTYLLTPSLPFDPDFFEVFATLCDVLIDCYMRITSLISSPAQCVPGLAEIFAKADAKLRKVIVTGIIKEFEDATRSGVKSEVAGIGKVVLGGLM